MPIYTYQCLYCQYTFDLLRPAADRVLPPLCPECKKVGVERPAKRVFSVGQLGIQVK